MITQIPILFLVLAAIIGVFIGLLISSLFSSKDSQPKQELPAELRKEGYGEIARFWYTPAGKKILLEMDGGHYKEFNALTKEQKAKALRLAELYQDWLAVQPETPSTPAREEAPEPANKPFVAEAAPENVAAESAIEEAPDLSFLEMTEEAPIPEPVSPFKLEEDEEDLINAFQESMKEEEGIAPAEAAPRAQLSITEQIGYILENLLAENNMTDKGVKLVENENHGVDVWVGVEKYNGIEEVPYPQVKELIREAVLRWEQENEAANRMGQ
jgi:hypothetical protein